MKRLLLLDTTSNCLDMALRAQSAGWQVKWYDRPHADGSPRLAGRGLVDKITDFNEIRRKWLDWADLIYMPDNTQWVDMLEPYRLKGYPILAPGVVATSWELDREVGQKVLDRAGVNVMLSKEFHDYDEAAKYVQRHPEYLVSKPSGDAAKALSYVASDPADLVYMLECWKRNPQLKTAARRDGFILQERKYGIEMAVGGWFGPHGFGQWFYENWEYKKLMDGDLGVNTGEMGTLSRMTKHSKLARQVLLPVAAQLHAINYVGYVDVNCIIDKEGPWPLEFTMRDGWPTKHNVTAHVKNDDPIQWMLDGLNGKDTLEAIEGEICVSVVMALPDFPYSRFTQKELCGIPLRIDNSVSMNDLHPSEIMIGTAPKMASGKVVMLPGWVTSGDYPVVVTGTSSSISKARAKVYAAVKGIKMPKDPFYRLDIGAGRMKRQLPDLHKLGYARGLEY